MNKLISVVTLTHDKVDCTRKCLSSLLAGTYRPWELVVVDNGSTDGTREWLCSFAEQAGEAGVALKIVQNDRNVGCSTARNHGADRASGDVLVFVDNDVALRSRHWLQGMLNALDADPGHAAVGPKLVYPFPPYDIQCAGTAISRSGRVQFIGRGDSRDDPRFGVERDVQCLISACLMVRRSCFDEVGGFDEAFNPVEYEDLDLCYHLRSAGHTVVYTPSVEMYHFENVTTCGTAALPNTYLIVKHGLLFKRRWKQMFEKEDGPDDAETKWRDLPARDFASIGELPAI